MKARTKGARYRNLTLRGGVIYYERLAYGPDRGRSLFLSLLGDRRMRVGADPEHGFRVEGVFDLGLDAGPARVREGLRAGRAFGSGGAIQPSRTRLP